MIDISKEIQAQELINKTAKEIANKLKQMTYLDEQIGNSEQLQTPTLEQVKEYFKNAKEVREIGYDKIFFINWENVYLSEYDNWCLEDGETIRYIWNKKKGYAEITSYKEEIKIPKHYDNSKGSIYKFCENQNLNSYEFDIIKRVVRCRKKGNFKEDLEKTKVLIDLYLSEYDN